MTPDTAPSRLLLPHCTILLQPLHLDLELLQASLQTHSSISQPEFHSLIQSDQNEPKKKAQSTTKAETDMSHLCLHLYG